MASVAKRKSNWFAVLWISETKKRQWIKLPADITTKREARAAAEKLEIQRRRAQLGLGTSASVAKKGLSAVCDDWLADIQPLVASRTFETYEAMVDRFVDYVKGATPVQSITAATCRAFVADLVDSGELGNETIRKTIGRLKSMFGQVVEQGLIPANPWDTVQPPRPSKARPRFIPQPLFSAILAAAPDERRFRWAVLAYTGARPCEARQITWNDVNLEGRRILLANAQKGAGVKPYRTVPIIDPLLPYLMAVPEKKRSGSLLRCGLNNWRRDFLIDVKNAGIDNAAACYTVYSLRHCFGSWMAQLGVELIQIRDMMGHATVKTTEIYAHLLPDAHHGVIEKTAKLCSSSVDKPKKESGPEDDTRAA